MDPRRYFFPNPNEKLHSTGESHVSGRHKYNHRYRLAANFCRAAMCSISPPVKITAPVHFRRWLSESSVLISSKTYRGSVVTCSVKIEHIHCHEKCLSEAPPVQSG
jgi:hypothetical protein